MTVKTREAATAALKAGRLAEAAALYEALCQQDPNDAGSWALLGDLQAALGDFARSVASLKQATALHPTHAPWWGNLGASQLDMGKPEDAIPSFHESLRLDPNQPGVHYNLASALTRLESYDAAVSSYLQAIDLNPSFAEAWLNLGSLYSQRGEYDKAVQAAKEALCLLPRYPQALNNLGQALSAVGQYDQAIQLYREAITLSPDYPEAHCNLAAALAHVGQPHEASQHARRALQLRPGFPEAANNLGNALIRLGDAGEAIRVLSAVTAGGRGYDAAQDNRLLALNYEPGLSPEAIAAEHRQWGSRHRQTFPAHVRHSHRRLRIAYLSPDFSAHSVSFFMEPILCQHERETFEVYAYANQTGADHVTERLHGYCDHWRTVDQFTDDRLAEQIRADEIDILVELAGHLRGNRLGVLARKPAPVQVSYLGYPNTTGLETVDASLTDDCLDPAGCENLYTETLVRLPNAFACYQPPDNAPDVDPPPMLAKGHVTFGSFHTLAKLNGPVLERWSGLLRAIPASRLRLQTFGLGEPIVRERILRTLTGMGVAAHRVELHAGGSFVDYLGSHRDVDIGLDTLPWSGHTVTCHALWMGVPTITLPGNRRAGRLGASALHAAGLVELVARDEADWMERTVSLAENPSRLSALRSGMREQLKSSSLCDAPGFVAGLESAYRMLQARV